MTTRAQNILFALFAAGFLVTAPAVVLSTAGYRYSTLRHRLEKTGILQTETEPRGASIVLDGTLRSEKTPAIIPRLLPEEYLVRLEKEGYLPWEKALQVESGKSAFATGVTLIKDAKPVAVLRGGMLLSSWNPRGTVLAFARQNEGGWIDIGIWSAEEGEQLVGRFGKDEMAPVTLRWSPDGSALLLEGKQEDERHFTVYAMNAAASGETAARVIEGLASLRWSVSGSELWGVSRQGIVRATAADAYAPALAIPGTFEDVADFDGSLLWLERSGDDTLLVRAGHDGSASATVATFARKQSLSLVAARLPYAVVADAATGAGELIDVSAPSRRTAVEARAVAWGQGDYGSAALACGDFSASAIDLATLRSQLITRMSAPLLGCAWHPSGDYAVIATAGQVLAIERDAREPRQHYLLAEGAIVAIEPDTRRDGLWITGDLDGEEGLFSRQF